mmetsp:Transcript_254/g.394  ORF Transcript_254/g.394 Transcript_254/m.394 type:complete len:690 (+) Transcript_254:118-2187(+)
MKISSLMMAAQAADFKSFDFIARTYHAAGYAEGTTSGTPDLYGYGLGALEKTAYDAEQQVMYGVSEVGYVTMIDFAKGPVEAAQVPAALSFEGSLTDVTICGDFLFISEKFDPEPGHVSIYKSAKRDTMGSVGLPELVTKVEVGIGPDMISANPSCDIIAVANEAEGDYGDELIDDEGSVSLIYAPFDGENVNVVQVSLDKWSDTELIAKGVHLPLPLNALIYWDTYSNIADDLNFTTVIENYKPAMNLEPEYLAWSGDGKTLFVNCQENSALVKVDIDTQTATDIYGYGLKSVADIGVDIVEDDGCSNMPKMPGLSFTRTPDSIASHTINGETYIFTANEGDDKEFGEYEERVKAKGIFKGAQLGMAGATADISVFDPNDITAGTSAFCNDDCDESNPATPFCSGSFRVTVGSSMIDFSNPEAPHIKQLVGIGGRGISIYNVGADSLDLVWDSGDDFEKMGCEAYPWAHNGIQDEEFAAVGGVLYNLLDPEDGLREAIEELNNPEEDGCDDGGDGNAGACPLGSTVDERSLKDGPAAEAIVVGEACGTSFVVTVSEKNSIGFVYQLDDVSTPELVKVFHLSEASELLNPSLAYAERSLGEIDSESILFVSKEDSPTGKAAVMFAGAFSGTVSYWEFSCDSDDATDTAPSAAPSAAPTAAPTEGSGSSAFIASSVIGLASSAVALMFMF